MYHPHILNTISPEYLYAARISSSVEKSMSTTEWLVAGVHNSLPKPACPRDWAEGRCAVSSICKLFTCKWFLSFISRDYFPVLEEGIFAKNTALNHVSSILVPLGFSHLLVFVPAHPASHLRSPGTASAQAQTAGRYLYLAIASFPLKTLRPNG